jgi:hypothetical protein
LNAYTITTDLDAARQAAIDGCDETLARLRAEMQEGAERIGAERAEIEERIERCQALVGEITHLFDLVRSSLDLGSSTITVTTPLGTHTFMPVEDNGA